MNKSQAEIYLRRYADSCLRLSKHCRERMEERDVTVDDILYVIYWGKIIELEENREYGNWLCTVKGFDIEGEELVFVAALNENENSVLCVTVKGG